MEDTGEQIKVKNLDQDGDEQNEENDLKIEFFEGTEEFKAYAESVIKKNTELLDPNEAKKFEVEARRYWDKFFLKNKDNFYKDRHYIAREFGLDSKVQELALAKNRRLNYLEIGCAVGNTMFPLVELYKNQMYVFGFDFSHNAINCIRLNPKYDTNKMYAFVGDLVQI